jgi:hypothetical protein
MKCLYYGAELTHLQGRYTPQMWACRNGSLHVFATEFFPPSLQDFDISNEAKVCRKCQKILRTKSFGASVTQKIYCHKCSIITSLHEIIKIYELSGVKSEHW